VEKRRAGTPEEQRTGGRRTKYGWVHRLLLSFPLGLKNVGQKPNKTKTTCSQNPHTPQR